MYQHVWSSPRATFVCATALDALIGGYPLLLLICGFFDLRLGPLTPQVEKPILLLLGAISLRIAVGGPSWFTERMYRAMPDVARLRTALVARIPPAVIDVLTIVIVTRLATFTIAFVANVVFPDARASGWEMPFEYGRFAEIFAAWDSGWYFDIARRGYFYDATRQSSIAFFPLYPALMRAAAWPFGSTDRALWLSGIFISWTAFVAALIALHRLTERVCGSRETAWRTILYLAVFPFSLFFTRVYAESLFLLTTVLAVSRACDGRWARAGVWGALAAVCRPNGILIAIPLGLMALDLRANPPWRTIAARLAALLPIPLALAGYSLYTYTLSGDPLAWLSAQSAWGNSIGNPPWGLLLSMIRQLVEHGWYEYVFVAPQAPFRLFHGVTALLFLTLVPSMLRRLGVPMTAYVLASLLVPLSANELEGIGRYASVLFPAFMFAATVESPRVRDVIVIVSAHFHALFICLFVTLRPIY